MSSETSWEKGNWKNGRITNRGFGEVFVAKNKTSNELVAIKKVKLNVNYEGVENEAELLKDCSSTFIVRYYGVHVVEDELWVRIWVVGNDEDCDGVLPLWIHCMFFEKRKSNQRRRNPRYSELLLTWFVLSPQPKCNAPSHCSKNRSRVGHQASQSANLRERSSETGRLRVGCSTGAFLFKTKHDVWHFPVHGS